MAGILNDRDREVGGELGNGRGKKKERERGRKSREVPRKGERKRNKC